MAESQITKFCPKCQTTKPIEAWCPSHRAINGKSCRECHYAGSQRWRKTDAGKRSTQATARKARLTDEYRTRRNANEQTRYATDPAYREHRRAKGREFSRSKRGRVLNAKRSAKYREANRDKVGARAAVNHAIEAGKVPRPDTLPCAECGGIACEYHHHRGYARENWLDVIAVCKLCHESLDVR